MAVECQDVKAVGGDVVGGTAEGYEPEEGQCCLYPEGSRNGEGYSGKAQAYKKLHGEYPPALGLDGIDERTPEGLYDPREVEPAGVKGEVGVRHAHLLIHGDGHCHYRHVRECFGKI